MWLDRSNKNITKIMWLDTAIQKRDHASHWVNIAKREQNSNTWLNRTHQGIQQGTILVIAKNIFRSFDSIQPPKARSHDLKQTTKNLAWVLKTRDLTQPTRQGSLRSCNSTQLTERWGGHCFVMISPHRKYTPLVRSSYPLKVSANSSLVMTW